MATPDLSFCTPCMGRLHHLRQTLPENLEAARRFSGRVEFVILNYNSPDGLEEWIFAHHSDAIRAGHVRYLRTSEPRSFHMAHAKNVAHKAARGRVVVNLDADNFITAPQIQAVLDLFAAHQRAIVASTSSPDSAGMIGLLKSDFLRLRGYAEEFNGWGREDREFVARAVEALGLTHFTLPPHRPPLQHSDEERIKHLADVAIAGDGEAIRELSGEAAELYRQLCARSQSLANIWLKNHEAFLKLRARGSVAVNGDHWGQANLVEPLC